MNIGATVLIGSLIFVLTNLVKSARGGDTNAVVTQVAAFAIGVGVIFLASAASVTSNFAFNGHLLNNLGWASKVFIGLLASSLFGAFNKVLGAIDNTRTSATPDLLPPADGPVVP